ncbi:MAG: SUMF1/EgtB/PvdO family nonheme iron enzyme [Bacteroidales bacterium]|nr:SUMF1/EgtB/PvdO family nonheme iron enzyme [Bacteroidales bacterium]
MAKYLKLASFALFAAIFTMLSSCTKEASRSTGWEYNNPKNGGFEVVPYKEPITGPGLVFIEGGTFTMGRMSDDPMYEWNNIPRRVTIPSFYMDETEVANIDYVEYLYWLNRVFGTNYPEVYRKALPDTLVWREKLAYNEPLIETYLRHPAYRNYPVVGISWTQASDYCLWRTDRVNEMMLIKSGILDFDPAQKNENNFNTEAYLAGQYDGLVNKPLPDLNPNGTGERRVRIEDGIMLPKYRLPTEAEWEFAAYGLIGNTHFERVVERRIYPWNGTILRTDDKKYYGSFVANFKRGRGDYMGVAGNLNDGAEIPSEVGSYWPNDYGLYNMAGNVSEWVLDVYRPLSFEDVSDFAPYRGNVFQTRITDAEGYLVPKDSLGRIKYRQVSEEEAMGRFNYRKANNINYLDGDYQSLIGVDWAQKGEDENNTQKMYEYGVTSLISDKARVYKGGSWKDAAFYLSPASRRYLDEDKSTNFIGFRCAMSRVGGSAPGKGR